LRKDLRAKGRPESGRAGNYIETFFDVSHGFAGFGFSVVVEAVADLARSVLSATSRWLVCFRISILAAISATSAISVRTGSHLPRSSLLSWCLSVRNALFLMVIDVSEFVNLIPWSVAFSHMISSVRTNVRTKL
jgi:hypothetical protein